MAVDPEDSKEETTMTSTERQPFDWDERLDAAAQKAGEVFNQEAMTSTNWEKEFDKEFTECDCRNNLVPHFEDSKVNRNWIKDFIRKTREEAVEEYKAQLVERVKEIRKEVPSKAGGLNTASEYAKKNGMSISKAYYLSRVFNVALDDILNIINNIH